MKNMDKRFGAKNMQMVRDMLVKECRGFSSSHTIDHILSLGLLSDSRTKALLARKMVERLTCEGMAKLDAIAECAEHLGCSEGTISNYIYNKSLD